MNSSAAPSNGQTQVVPADRWRQIAVVVSAVLGFAVASFGSGAIAGTPVTEVAGGVLDTDGTLVAPGGTAFAIWGVIYTGLLAGLLVVLLRALQRLTVAPAGSRLEKVIVDGTLGLYLGWVCIATVANTAAALVWEGVEPTGTAATAWALAILLVAGGVGVLLAVGLRRIAPGIGLAWGLLWVSVERATAEPASSAVALAAAVAAAVTLLTAFAAVRGGPADAQSV
jgi:hypothetical protein